MTMNIDAIMDLARDPQTKIEVAKTLYRMVPNYWHFRYLTMLLGGQKEKWFDLLTFLYAAAKVEQPETYFEVGVHKGGSMAQVLSQSPKTRCLGFDIWPKDYAMVEGWGEHMPSSEDFVRSEMAKICPNHYIEFIAGDTHQTLPAYFAENPDAMFDLALVDGGHSQECARSDLLAVVGHARILAFDDIIHPTEPGLEAVWDEVLAGCGRKFVEFKDHFDVGTAVAFFQ